MKLTEPEFTKDEGIDYTIVRSLLKSPLSSDKPVNYDILYELKSNFYKNLFEYVSTVYDDYDIQKTIKKMLRLADNFYRLAGHCPYSYTRSDNDV